uniref:Uncharacterized protein n=1 Tax=Grammatophora oceanica TaxID=210454 RepID=A0A7S1UW20_9STRA|eukprot:CAMPEP_0194069086 /NCGR_PEP_ID=MMETSP0009_2-20130614/87446_1 /TAXON_ID=210454 /ORGANISM="Grammatophora oceanica, Strain CCMP 410" /LENGTH=536 /DNA_ID=CAMNT_0038722245 /DNA_START=34 /DNA_END=1644 /DNA_ORIENTATION=-
MTKSNSTEMTTTTSRERRPCNVDGEKESYSDILRSLFAPWATLVVFAIVASSLHSYYSDYLYGDDENGRALQKEGEFVFNEEHKPLHPLDSTDYIGFGCAILGLMVAAGGGIGGGGILVPTYILVMGFSPKHAIPLSNVTVLGGAIANSLLNSRKRHPLADRPLIDWDLILVMEPLTIAGALIGAFLNKLLPEQLLIVMLVLLLSFTAYKSLVKAVKMYKIESRHLAAEKQQQLLAKAVPTTTKESELTKIVHEEDLADDDAAQEALLEHMELQEGEVPGDGGESIVSLSESVQIRNELQQILEEERETPMMNVMILVTMFIVVLAINLMKGGGSLKSPVGITCGSTSFWLANIVMLGWIVVVTFFCRSYLVRRFHEKARVGYEYVVGDIKWDERATVVYPLVCCVAGFFAGMFGIGGGIVKGPLMLAMGVHPAVSSASSACMILFTSFTATTSFIVFGLLLFDYGLICLAIGFVATLFGQMGLGYLMKKSKRNSYIAFSIGGVVLLSAFLMTIQSLISMAESHHHHSGGICGKDE